MDKIRSCFQWTKSLLSLAYNMSDRSLLNLLIGYSDGQNQLLRLRRGKETFRLHRRWERWSLCGHEARGRRCSASQEGLPCVGSDPPQPEPYQSQDSGVDRRGRTWDRPAELGRRIGPPGEWECEGRPLGPCDLQVPDKSSRRCPQISRRGSSRARALFFNCLMKSKHSGGSNSICLVQEKCYLATWWSPNVKCQ